MDQQHQALEIQCDKLEEQIRLICSFASLDVSEERKALGLSAFPRYGLSKTLNMNDIYKIVEISSAIKNKDVVIQVIGDAFRKMENARTHIKSSNIEQAASELCSGFLLAGIVYSKFYSPDASMTTAEASSKAKRNASSQKNQLITEIKKRLDNWSSSNTKTTVDSISKELAEQLVNDSGGAALIRGIWPTLWGKAAATDQNSIITPLTTRIRGYINRQPVLKEAMNKIRQRSCHDPR